MKKTTVKVEMKPVDTILTRLGINKNGDVQGFLVNTVNRRITRYMPYRTGVLSTKVKYIKSPTEIEVAADYARYQYYGKVMIGPPPKVATSKLLNQAPHAPGNDRAGPFWDRRMMAAEGDQIVSEVQGYINRK